VYRQLYRLMRLANPREFRTLKYTRELERNQWLSPGELKQVSWRKLKRLLDHAYVNVPFYRQRFQEIGLSPEDIRAEEDFRQIPLLSKENIRENADALLARNFARSELRRKTTSGSTGVPLVLYCERAHDSADVAAFTRSRRWFGCEPGDKIAWIWGRRGDIPANFTLKQRIKRERWLDGYRPTPERLQQFAEMLVDWEPDMLAGYGNVIYLLAKYLDSQKITGIRPKVVETTAMTIWPHEREMIERVFQCPVSDRYSSHEAGAIIAAECPEGSKHVFSDFCYVEIITDGRPADPGEMGEVVITSLYNYGMPLIRYRMGDIATFADRECSCGRGLSVLRELAGRTTSIFTLPSGAFLYGGAFRHLVLQDAMAIRRFRVHQYSKERIEVFLERGVGFDDSVVDMIRERCLRLLEGEPVELTITVTDEMLTTPAGKFLVTSSDVPVAFN
jgi:phenylacetate-CoA ligase